MIKQAFVYLLERKCKDKELKNYFIKNAEYFKEKKINLLDSIMMAQRENTIKRACHENCIDISESYDDLKWYIGYCSTKHIFYPIFHSWLVNDVGEVIDTTLILDKQKKEFKNRLNNKYEFYLPYEYFGIEYDKHDDIITDINPNWEKTLSKMEGRM